MADLKSNAVTALDPLGLVVRPSPAPATIVPVRAGNPDNGAIVVEQPPAWALLLSAAGAGAAGYHGYRRTRSVGWAIGWAALGGLFPVVTNAIAVAQGFGKRE